MENKPKLRGRPFKYNSPDELREVIQQYFDDTDPEEYTVTGLALAVGSKQTLDDYQGREGFTEIVREAKLIVENAYEISLRKNGRTGDIFALKNFGWKDKQEVESSGGQEITITRKIINGKKD